MSAHDKLAAILEELTRNARSVDAEQLQRLVAEILAADRIFLAGAGRSGLASRAFANRLLHLGKSVSVVGDVTSPHSRPGDLLIIGSGSGQTEGLLALAASAHAAGLRVAAMTMDRASRIAQLADLTLVLPGVSPKLHEQSAQTSLQPLASAFEQLLLLTYDAVVLELMVELGQTADSMYARHADLE
ncbi:3-hexulose-6-phosphate isomerase [Propionicimonas sp. T2.31MG-18]|uniref:6-phospho-3-hexuloisomerase n=1 Tax=Propionicimonas sp. T2.31MG-18 TaxID=3157620 RepID=UPI0035EF0EA0